VQEGGEEVARKLLRVDVVLVVSSVRSKRGWSGRTMVKSIGDSGQNGQRDVLVARAWGNGEELAMKLQWGVVVPVEHGIVGVGRLRRLTTASRERGDGLAGCLAEGKPKK
jgi:hypothetical protein